MARLTILAFAALTLGASPAAPAAQAPSALAQSMAGQWVFEGLPGAKSALRQCVGDIQALAQFEHRSRSCKQRVISNSASSTVVEYSCGEGEFGHSQVDVLTPRSLRISTQGISGNQPFNYVLQAHRVGECPKSVSASRH